MINENDVMDSSSLFLRTLCCHCCCFAIVSFVFLDTSSNCYSLSLAPLSYSSSSSSSAGIPLSRRTITPSLSSSSSSSCSSSLNGIGHDERRQTKKQQQQLLPENDDNDNDNNDDDATVNWINELVEERSQARWNGNFTGADRLRQQILNLTVTSIIPSGCEIVLDDLPRSIGGGTKWYLVKSQPTMGRQYTARDNNNMQTTVPLMERRRRRKGDDGSKNNNQSSLEYSSSLSSSSSSSSSVFANLTILQLAHAALDLAIDGTCTTTISSSQKDKSKSKLDENQYYRHRQQQQQDFVNEENSLELELELDLLVRHVKYRLEMIEQDNNDNTAGNSHDLNFGSWDPSSSSSITTNVKRRRTQHHHHFHHELDGRKAADAAFWFALAGIQEEDIFRRLADIAARELVRFGHRSSCRTKDVFQILDRFAAAGLKRHTTLETVARECLLLKNRKQQQQQEEDEMILIHDDDILSSSSSSSSSSPETVDNNDSTSTNKKKESNKHSPQQDEQQDFSNDLLDFHSDRPLLLLWKFSSKQKKRRSSSYLHSSVQNNRSWRQHSTESTDIVIATTGKVEEEEGMINTPHYNWDEIFQDATRPLVIDIGSGMGVSLLGLASSSSTIDENFGIDSNRKLEDNVNDTKGETGDLLQWSDCNFFGVDLGEFGIGYSRGMAHRWNLQGRLYFAVDAADDFFQKHLNSYPGDILCCMIQFPT